jgi:hypothetical protein
VVFERGLSALIGGDDGAGRDDGAAPESIAALLSPAGGTADPEVAARKISEWLAAGVLLRERRPALWIYRRSPPGEVAPEAPLLLGLVRLAAAGSAPPPSDSPADPASVEERLALRRAMKADFEPCLLATRAPLTEALATTRRPDFSAEESSGARHDAWRLHEYAQHVELQGLVKNPEVEVARGPDLWQAARALDRDPEAARWPGARFKLCAIVEEAELREERAESFRSIPAGLFGVSLEDPVY